MPTLAPCTAPKSRILRALNLGFNLALLPLCTAVVAAAVDATLTPASITSTSTTPVVLHVTGLVSGGSVIVERIVDANADGVVDAGEFLVERFTLTSGQVPAIGGVRDINQPGDEDLLADGQLSVKLTPALGAELGRLAGQQIIRVSSPTAAFAPVTRNLTITQPVQAQSISGTVGDGTNLLPYAGVFLLDASTDGEFAGGVFADALGHFTLVAPVGTYQIAAIKAGHLANFGTDPVGLGFGAALTQDVVVVPATTSITGRVADNGSGAGLGGVQVFAGNQGGLASIVSTNADGTYVAPVTAGQWDIEVSRTCLSHLGYLGLNNQNGAVTADTTGGAATGVNISVPKASALIHGTVTNSSATPMAGIQMGADNSNHTYNCDATTDADGYYVIGVTAGTWQAYVSQDSPGLAGYVVPNSQSVTPGDGLAVRADFSLLAVNAHMQGVVTNGVTPVVGVQINAYNQSANRVITAQTAVDGSFNLGLTAGTWNLQLESASAASHGLVSPVLNYTLSAGETISGITLEVKSTTAQITGWVRDSSSQALSARVNANATIGGVLYFASMQTDGSGNYALPVIDGTWQMGVFANNFDSPAPAGVPISGAGATRNFTLTKAPAITTQPSDQTVTTGLTATFSVGVIASPAPTFQWQVSTDGGSTWNNQGNDPTYAGVTTATLNLTSNIGLSGYRYRCIATNTAGAATSNAAILSVSPAVPPNITQQPVNSTVTAGQNALFTVAAGGAPAPTFQWQISTNNGATWGDLGNDSSHSGVATPSLTVSAALIGQSGHRYRAVATNTAGSATSNAAVLTVSEAAAVAATLTPASTTSTSTTPVVLQVTGLATGGSVIVERFVDANADGVVDAGEFLAERFTLTSGQVPAIGGVRDINQPGDEDLAADGQLSVKLTPALGAELGRFAGQQLIRVSSPTAAFAPVTRNLTITQPVQAQSISGTVGDGTNPLPFAGVFLLDATTDGEFAGGVFADAAGHFTLAAPVGTYQIAAIKAGHLADFGTDPVGLGVGAAVTQDVVVVPATTSITGRVADNGSGAGLGGVQVFAGNQDGLASIVSTNADGTYVAPVTAGQWDIEVSRTSLNHLGYLGLSNQNGAISADTTGGAVTGVNISVPKVSALIHGTVTDSSATPMAGIQMGADNSNHTYNCDATTDADGYYVIGVTAGTWQAYVSQDSPGLAGYVLPNGQSLTPTDAQAVRADFALVAINAHLQGVVTNTDTPAPVPGVQINAYNPSTNRVITAQAAADGSFDLGLIAGTWNVQLESSSAASHGLVSSSVSYTLTDNQTISGITLAVRTATAQITGWVRDSNSQALSARVSANATIGGVSYFASMQTDASGNYALPVIDGTWYINVSASGYSSPNQRIRTVPSSDTVCNYTLTKAPAVSQPASRTVTAGQSAVFTINANSNSPVSFQWQVSTDNGSTWSNLANDSTYSGATLNSLNVASNIGLNGFRYRCVATNSFGSTASSGALLTVNVLTVPANITGQPANCTVTASQNASFTVVAGGTPAPALQWQLSTDSGGTWTNLVNDSTYSGATLPTLTVNATLVGQSGYRFRAVATNSAGTATSDAAVLTVNPLGVLQIISSAALPNAMVGSSYAVGLQASGGLPPYTWAVVSGALPGELTLHPSTGIIAGTPAAAGTINLTVQVTDGGSTTATRAVSLVIDAVPPFSFKWSLALNGGPVYYSSPAIGSGGVIYVGTGAPFNGAAVRGLYAVNPNGTIKWQYTSADMLSMFTPAVGADGTIYVQDFNSSLYAVNTDGSLKWKYTLSKWLDVGQTAPAIGADGTIYVGADTLYAINPNGTLKWRNAHNGMGGANVVRSSPAIAANGTIYVGMNGYFGDPGVAFGNALVALNPDGSFKWEYILQGTSWVLSSPAIGADGTIFIGAETSGDLSYVYAVNPDGTLKWRYDVTGGRTIRSSPALGSDGTVYIGTKSGASVNADFLALNPDGTLKWKYSIDTAGADIYCSPAVGADGLIYFGAETGDLYALNPNGSLAWKYGTGNGINWTSPAIDSDGTIYIGNNNGNLVALSTGSMGLAESAWPKFRNDNRNAASLASSLSAQATWRQTNFGDPSNSGDGADLNDFDNDGLVNLLEYAFGLNPKQNSAGLLPQPQRSGDNLVLSFTQPAGVSGVTYGAEWSATMQASDWHPVTDTGSGSQHTFSVPAGGNASLFMRMKVTNP